jgi:hypothetical protein
MATTMAIPVPQMHCRGGGRIPVGEELQNELPYLYVVNAKWPF